MRTGTKNTITYLLPASMTIDTVSELAAEFCSMNLRGKTLILDGRKMKLMTAPGVQLLCALERFLSRSGGTLQMIHAKVALETLESFGLHVAH